MFIAGSNMPGYMPDNSPAEFETFDEAKRYVISLVKNEELSREWNYEGDEGKSEIESEELCAFAEEVNLQSKEFSARCLNMVYWVTTE